MTMLGDALKELTDNHKLDPITDTQRVKSQGCKLKSGEESLFVTVLCCEIQRRLEKQGIHLPVNEFFYCPSRRTEWKLGFDLSIGTGSPHRIRTMHKLLTGNLCDGKWTWATKDEDTLHLALLMGAHHAHHGVLQPFLVIHVCFCVHDYRRMGAPAPDKWLIPGFDSPLRTIIIDLAALRDAVDKLKDIDWLKLAGAVTKAEDKGQAVDVLDEFDVGRLKVVRDKPLPDLAKLKAEPKDILDQYCPKLYYPSTTAVTDHRRFFLTFDEFMERVTAIARQR